jgi:acyl-[acyl-carrier-protein]-phospholipid O-acyltransferase / long-chain-fatty-acid--[acyl-carrier-protein] ligase
MSIESSAASLKDLTLMGKENLPANEGFLLLPSQLSFYDLLRLETVLKGRKLVYLIDAGAGFHPLLNAHLHRDGVDALELSASTDVAAYRSTMQELAKEGAVVIYVPEEASAVAAPLCTVPGMRLDYLLQAGIPVLPTLVQRLKDTQLPITRTVSDGEAVMAFGPILRGDGVSLPAYQESLLALAEQVFSAQPFLNMHLGYALMLGLKKHGTRNVFIDGRDDSSLRFDKIFAAALALSKFIKKETTEKRVGIVLPPSPGALIANIAVVLAGKTPVNLNFTAGRGAIESSIRQAGMDRFITADKFVAKVQSFPWPPMKNLIMLERLMPTLKVSSALWYFASKLLPASLLATLIGLPKRGGNAEATLLFTSGSSGDPKGVVLTHRNLLANVCQFGSRLNMKNSDSILACLPLFHSFGCTVTLWYPLIYGLNLVSYPSPLETKKLAELIQQHKVTVMLATPTFLRGYMRGVHREQLASLKLVVTGAEKLPRSVADAFENRFGKRVLEGYGLTETSPVSNVNLNDPEPSGTEGANHIAPAYRSGSVGQLVPGLALRVTNTDTGQPQSVHQSGIIWFKGANVFTGYLNDPKRSAEVLDAEGWFRTGDVGRLDLDGFLYIEGRMSRFSKIAGEMVPHETVEEAINKALGLENEAGRKIAIVGVPDIDKGEALVLLTTIPGAPEQTEIVALRHRMIDYGLAPLWIPKKMIRVADIPILASGKLDIKGCENIARAGTYG